MVKSISDARQKCGQLLAKASLTHNSSLAREEVCKNVGRSFFLFRWRARSCFLSSANVPAMDFIFSKSSRQCFGPTAHPHQRNKHTARLWEQVITTHFYICWYSVTSSGHSYFQVSKGGSQEKKYKREEVRDGRFGQQTAVSWVNVKVNGEFFYRAKWPHIDYISEVTHWMWHRYINNWVILWQKLDQTQIVWWRSGAPVVGTLQRSCCFGNGDECGVSDWKSTYSVFRFEDVLDTVLAFFPDMFQGLKVG